jgi:hypothetical protein
LEEAMPSYYTNWEADPNVAWYKKIFTANMLWDKAIKNLGFVVGAAASFGFGAGVAGITTKVLSSALKGATSLVKTGKFASTAANVFNQTDDFALGSKNLLNMLSVEGKKVTAQKYFTNALAGAFSALSEAGMEGRRAGEEYINEQKANIDNYALKYTDDVIREMYNANPNAFEIISTRDNIGNSTMKFIPKEESTFKEIERRVNEFKDKAMEKVAKDAAIVSNQTFLSQLPILLFSDIYQFGKYFGGGFKTAKRTKSIVNRVSGAADDALKYEAKKINPLTTVAKMAGRGFTEGIVEEMGQAMTVTAAKRRMGSELNSYFGAKIDPESESEVIGIANSLVDAFKDTYADGFGKSTWEEGFIGFILGSLGVPKFQAMKSETGKIKSPITLRGGSLAIYKEDKLENAKREELADKVNKYVNKPEFRAS